MTLAAQCLDCGKEHPWEDIFGVEDGPHLIYCIYGAAVQTSRQVPDCQNW